MNIDWIAVITEPRTWAVIFVIACAKTTVALAAGWSDAQRAIGGSFVATLVSTPLGFAILLASGLSWGTGALVWLAATVVDAAMLHAIDRKAPPKSAAVAAVGNLLAWGVFLGMLGVASQGSGPALKERDAAAQQRVEQRVPKAKKAGKPPRPPVVAPPGGDTPSAPHPEGGAALAPAPEPAAPTDPAAAP